MISNLAQNQPDGHSLGASLITYPNRRAELSIWTTDGRPRKHHGRRASNRDEMTPETIAAAQARTKRVIRQKIMTIQADRMFTFTYAENMTDPQKAWYHWKLFLKRCRRNGIEFQYVAVAERQDRGAIHIHAAVNQFLNVRVIQHHWNAVVGQESPNSVDVSKPRKGKNWKPERLAMYLSKYITKDLVADFGKHRYSSSRGIEIKKNVQYFGRGLSQFYIEQFFKEQTGLEPRTSLQLEYSCFWLCSWDTRPPSQRGAT